MMHTTIPRCLRPQCTSICAAEALDGLEAFPSDQHRMVAVDNGVSLLCSSSARQKWKNAQLKDDRTKSGREEERAKPTERRRRAFS